MRFPFPAPSVLEVYCSVWHHSLQKWPELREYTYHRFGMVQVVSPIVAVSEGEYIGYHHILYCLLGFSNRRQLLWFASWRNRNSEFCSQAQASKQILHVSTLGQSYTYFLLAPAVGLDILERSVY